MSDRDRAAAVARVTAWGIGAMLVIVVLRVGQLQLAPGARLDAMVSERMSATPLPGIRGELRDRRGRLLSATSMGERVFIDPEAVTKPADVIIAEVGEALALEGDAMDMLALRVVDAIEDNRERRAARDRGDANMPDLIRYRVLTGIVEPARAEAVRGLRLAGVHVERRPVRSYPGAGLAAALVGKVDAEQAGALGAERAHDAELRGTDGRVRFVRDARGRPLWVGDGALRPAEAGDDVRLSIDVEMQRIAVEELERGITECDAAGGRIIVVDPYTGEILAMADRFGDVSDLAEFPWADKDGTGPNPYDGRVGERRRYRTLKPDPWREIEPSLARNRCVEDVYEPGSTFKPFVWAAVTQSGRHAVDDVIDTEGGVWATAYRRRVEDVTRRDEMTWGEVLRFSSNIGLVKATQDLSHEWLRGVVVSLGFGNATGIGLAGEASGLVRSEKGWDKYTQTSVSFGHEIAVTPLQMARAFSVFARGGDLAGSLPRLTLRQVGDVRLSLVQRVFDPAVVVEARRVLRQVAERVEEKMERRGGESGWRYSMFGKSGTAEIPLGAPPKGMRRPRGVRGYFEDQYNSSFVAAGPIDVPQIVVMVVIDDPGPERIRAKRHYGSDTAGPVARRVIERTLGYLGIPGDLGGPDEPEGSTVVSR